MTVLAGKQTMLDEADFAPIVDAHWPAEITELRTGFAGRLNVYRVMAHHPQLLRAWQSYRDHVVVHTALDRQTSELVILRTGHRLDAAYEWAHHVVRGRATGLADARIQSMRGPLSAMTADDAAFARAVDELVDDAMMTSETLAEMTGRVGRHGVLDLMATVGLYSTLAFIVKTFDTPIDADIPATP